MPIKNIGLFFLSILVLSCQQPESDRVNDNEIRSGKMSETTTIQQKTFHFTLKPKACTEFTGQVAIIAFPIDVQVFNVNIKNGDYVKKGQTLFSIQHPEIIKLQQEYLATLALYNQYKSNFNRQGELAMEQATSLKVMEKEQAFYLQFEAGKKALESTLRILQINPETISTDHILTKVEIKSATEGIVSICDIQQGKLLKTGDMALRLINTDHLAFNIELPALYYPFIQTGDSIVIIPWADGVDSLFLNVQTKALQITDKGTFLIHSNEIINPNLPNNYTVNTLVKFSSEQLSCVHSGYIYHNEYLILKKHQSIDTVLVNTGITNNGFTQLINYGFRQERPVVLKP